MTTPIDEAKMREAASAVAARAVARAFQDRTGHGNRTPATYRQMRPDELAVIVTAAFEVGAMWASGVTELPDT